MAIIALVGNPNCGKTTVFNALTGADQTVGNWPGVTVELKKGSFSNRKDSFEVVDLPGIYSLTASSFDEQIARDFILHQHPDLVVNIVDASNLERNLYLTVQLIEMRVPCLLVLNMMDEARRKHIHIDVKVLSELLDTCVIMTAAHQGEGMEDLRQAISCSCMGLRASKAMVHYPDELEAMIARLQDVVSSGHGESGHDKYWLAVKLFEEAEDFKVCPVSGKVLADIHLARERARVIYGEDVDMIMADARYGLVNAITKKSVDRSKISKFDVSDMMDRFVLSRFFGVPFFLVVMYLAFWATINLGGCFIDFFDVVAGALFVDLPRYALQLIHAPAFLITILADGAGSGLQTVATFVPPIFFMFLCLAILDDSGYMARAAFVMDKAMRFLGLPGKSFVPLLIGFGCNVPGILATRTLEDKNDRIVTIMMNPLMSCGARLPIYALFAVAFFPDSGGFVIFMLYIVGVLMAAMTAMILRKTLFSGHGSPFIMELPPYHVPTVRGVLLHTWQRLKCFILKAGQAIVMVVVVLTILNNVVFKGPSQDNPSSSVLAGIGKVITPVFSPMGIREDNWPASVGIVTGVMFKESVIATLDSLYTQQGGPPVVSDESQWDGILRKLRTAWDSVTRNLKGLQPPFVIGKHADLNQDIAEHHVQTSTHDALRMHFDGKAGAFAFLLLILLYMPCLSSIGAVYQELGWRWTMFSVIYLSVLAWSVATIFYQTARFHHDPVGAMGWISFVTAVFIGIIVFLKTIGARLLKVVPTGSASCRSGCSACASCH